MDTQPKNQEENNAAGQANGKVRPGDQQFPEGGPQVERNQHFEIVIDGEDNSNDADDRQDNEIGLDDGPK